TAGTININAIANATGMGMTTGATPVAILGNATAAANVDGGIAQDALAKSGTGNASASLSNAAGGTINIGANATAKGGPAVASAGVTSGIQQHVEAKSGGDALASITNGGTINIDAVAHATGDARARAEINGGIGQAATAY